MKNTPFNRAVNNPNIIAEAELRQAINESLLDANILQQRVYSKAVYTTESDTLKEMGVELHVTTQNSQFSDTPFTNATLIIRSNDAEISSQVCEQIEDALAYSGISDVVVSQQRPLSKPENVARIATKAAAAAAAMETPKAAATPPKTSTADNSCIPELCGA